MFLITSANSAAKCEEMEYMQVQLIYPFIRDNFVGVHFETV